MSGWTLNAFARVCRNSAEGVGGPGDQGSRLRAVDREVLEPVERVGVEGKLAGRGDGDLGGQQFHPGLGLVEECTAECRAAASRSEKAVTFGIVERLPDDLRHAQRDAGHVLVVGDADGVAGHPLGRADLRQELGAGL